MVITVIKQFTKYDSIATNLAAVVVVLLPVSVEVGAVSNLEALRRRGTEKRSDVAEALGAVNSAAKRCLCQDLVR